MSIILCVCEGKKEQMYIGRPKKGMETGEKKIQGIANMLRRKFHMSIQTKPNRHINDNTSNNIIF